MLEQTFNGRDVHTRNMAQYNSIMILLRRSNMLSDAARNSLFVWAWNLVSRFSGLVANDLPLDYQGMANNMRASLSRNGSNSIPNPTNPPTMSLYDILMKFIDSEGKVSGAMNALLRTPAYNRRLHIRFNSNVTPGKVGASKGFFQQSRMGSVKQDAVTLAPGLLMVVGAHRSGKTSLLGKMKISEVLTPIRGGVDSFDAWKLHTNRLIPDNIKIAEMLSNAINTNNTQEISTQRALLSHETEIINLMDRQNGNLIELETNLFANRSIIGLEGEADAAVSYRIAMNEPDAICSGLPSEASILLSLIEGLEDMKPRTVADSIARVFTIDSLTSLHETSKGVIKTKGLNYGIMPYIDELVQLAMWRPMVATMSFEESELPIFLEKLKGRVPNIIAIDSNGTNLFSRGSVPFCSFKQDLEISMAPLDSTNAINSMKGVY